MRLRSWLTRTFRLTSPLNMFLCLFGAILVVTTALWTTVGNDIWFLLAYGRYVVTTGTFPTTDPLSMHDVAFVMPQWAFSVIIWRLYCLFGQWGPYVFSSLMWLGCDIMMIVVARDVGGNRPASDAGAILAAILLMPFHDVRPSSVSLLLLLAVLHVCLAYVRDGRRGRLTWIPVLSMLLVNFHASLWPMMFVIALPFVASRLYVLVTDRFHVRRPVPGMPTPVGPLVLAFAVAVPAGLVDPYGIDAVLYLSRSYGYAAIDATVREMNPVSLSNAPSFLAIILVLVAAMVACLVHRRTRENADLAYVLFVAGFCLLGLQHVRGMAFPIAMGIPIMVGLMMPALDGLMTTRPDLRQTHLSPAFMGLATIGVLAAAAFLTLRSLSNVVTTYQPDVAQAVSDVTSDADYQPSDTVYTDYNEGDYAEFMGLRAYLDARAEVFLESENRTKDVFDEWYDVEISKTSSGDFVDRYEFDYMIVSPNVLDPLYFEMDTRSDYVLLDRYTTTDGTTFGVWKHV